MLGIKVLPLLPAKTVRELFDPAVGEPCRCGHLKNRADGTYECAIYEDRPDICRVDKAWEFNAGDTGLTREEYYEVAGRACFTLRRLV